MIKATVVNFAGYIFQAILKGDIIIPIISTEIFRGEGEFNRIIIIFGKK